MSIAHSNEHLWTMVAGKPMLRIWHIPQVPGKPFYVNVGSIAEATKLLAVIANYDKFQFDNNIKPDYCNVGGLEYFDNQENEWLEWENEDGLNINDVT